MFKIKAEKRDVKKSANALRKEGKIPAVFYGRKEKSTSIAVPAIDFQKIWRQAGESSIVTLSVEGKDISALINEVALEPVRSTPIHVDFYAVEADRPVEVHVPLEFIGEAPATKDLGGILLKVLHELPIKGLPKDLPQHLSVDISSLATLESQITVGDIPVPQGITILSNPEEVIVSITVFKETEEKPEETFDASTIEVEKKGKKEEEEIPSEGEGESA